MYLVLLFVDVYVLFIFYASALLRWRFAASVLGMEAAIHTHTHIHTCMYIYIYICRVNPTAAKSFRRLDWLWVNPMATLPIYNIMGDARASGSLRVVWVVDTH